MSNFKIKNNYSVAYCDVCNKYTVFEYDRAIRHKVCSDCGFHPSRKIISTSLMTKQAEDKAKTLNNKKRRE